MSQSYNAFNHKAWDEAGLKDFGDFADMVEYINQSEYGDGQLEGEWYYCDDEKLTIYTGTFGNYNSPGASSYTNADVYEADEKEEYEAEKKRLEACDEYSEEQHEAWDAEDDDECDEDDCDDEDDDTGSEWAEKPMGPG